jgi:type VI secretion system protein ImpH
MCTVEQHLTREPFAFDFFQAVRLLARLSPTQTPVGQGGPPSREVVRFRALPSLEFPASAVHALATSLPDQTVPVLTVTFLGLHGPSGVLPRHYTEMILRLERDRRGEERRAFRDWLDLFNHRLISLFYRAWEKYRFWLPYERGEHDRADPDAFTRVLLSLVGLGTPGLRNRLRVRAVEPDTGRERPLAAVDDRYLLYFSGLLASRHRTAAGLAALLADYFRIPVRVQQFVGQWLAIEPANQTRLGRRDGNSQLGIDMVAGGRAWDVQSKLRVRLGPLDYDRFTEFMPDRSPRPERKGFLLLVHLVRLYAGPELDFDVQPVLRADAVPDLQMSNGPPGPRLGWNTWLISRQPAVDAGDALFSSEVVVRLDDPDGSRIPSPNLTRNAPCPSPT